jgi:hypothetical protein
MDRSHVNTGTSRGALAISLIFTLSALALATFALAACVSDKVSAGMDGLNTSHVTIETRKRGDMQPVAAALIDTMKSCWVTQDALFEGFKVTELEDGPGGSKSVMLDGPISGSPPQRFLIVLTPNGNGRPGYDVGMDYPLGSNYAFVRTRLAHDLKVLETGRQPCA